MIGESIKREVVMDAATEERLERAWEHTWTEIEKADIACREATRPVDSVIKDLAAWFKDTLSEAQARAFGMFLNLKEEVSVDLHVLEEDLHFQLGYLVGCGRLIDQVPELLAEYPRRMAQEIEKRKMADRVLAAADDVRKSIDEDEENPEPGHLELV